MENYENSKLYVKEKIKNLYSKHHEGFFIREARLRQGLTQKQVAENICTISYLSRIETGAAKPNSTLLKKLSRKLNIDPEQNHHSQEWLPIFKVLVCQHSFPLLKKFIETPTSYDYQKSLKQFCFAIIHEQYDIAREKKRILHKLEPFFLLEELQLYYLFLSVYYQNDFQSSLTIKYANLSLKIAAHLKINDPYLLLHLACYHFKAQLAAKGFFYLEKALNYFREIYATKYIIDCELILCRESIKLKHFKHAKLIIDRLKNILNYHDPYNQYPMLLDINAFFFECKKNYSLAEQYYQKALSLRRSGEATLALIKLYYHTNEPKKLQKLLTSIDPQQFNLSINLKIRYYYLLSSNPYHKDLPRLLSKEAIPLAREDHDSHYVSLYMESLIAYYKHHSKYKASVDVFQQLKNYLLEVSS